MTVIRFGVVDPMSNASIDNYEAFELVYPDGSNNAEGLMVHPKTGELYILTKPSQGGTSIYRPATPLLDNERIDLEHVVDIDLLDFDVAGSTLVTGADFSPDGKSMIIRTYSGVFLLDAQGLVDSNVWNEGGFCEGAVASEPQGEAIVFSVDGSGYYTISEGENPDINWVELFWN